MPDVSMAGSVVKLNGSELRETPIISITVDFEWKDLRSGKILVARQQFEAGSDYIPSQPVGERPQVGLWAVSQELAQDIVGTMREAW